MKFELDLTQSEYVEASLLPWKKRRRQQMIWMIIIGAAAGVCAFTMPEPLREVEGTVAFIMLFTMVWNPFATRNRLRKLWKDHPLLRETQTCTIDNVGLSTEGNSGASTHFWRALSHWTENRRLMVIHFGPILCYAIPKRCLNGDKQIDELRDILKVEIGRTKYEPPTQAFPVAISTAAPSSIGPQTPLP